MVTIEEMSDYETNNVEVDKQNDFIDPKISGNEEKMLNLIVEIIVKILFKEVK